MVAAVPIYGNFVPLRAIVADLVRRGHDVTFLTTTSSR
jgi:UDP:flavonoid glycosyltransferase YjiC (YdhE family)